jgi:capping protein beta
MSEAMKSCLNILRRTPPSDVPDNLERLIALRGDLDEELCQRVDTPLEMETDKKVGKPFLLCDYNRDGDSYRSPWSNNYYPALDDGDDGFKPSENLRKLEIEANQVFDIYRHQYFEGGVSSVYMWNLDDNNDDKFAACFCIQKDAEGDKELKGFKGTWSSVHVFEVVPQGKKNEFNYKLTSSALVSMPLQLKGLGDIDLSGSLTKQAQKTGVLQTIGDQRQSHLEVMGPMLEDLELDLRTTMESVYFQKTKEVINGMRVTDAEMRERAKKNADMMKKAAQ